MKLTLWVGIFSLAAAGFWFPWNHRQDGHIVEALWVSVLAGSAWIFLLVLGVAHYGKRILWALAAAPLALFWPAIVVWLVIACSFVNVNYCAW